MRSITYRGDVFEYELIRKDVKNINLRVRADGSVTVSANNSIPEEEIIKFVTTKAEYILLNINKFRELNKYLTSPKEYIGGESFCLLGKNLRLKLFKGEQNDIKSDGVYLYLTTFNKDDFATKESLVNDYFDKLCIDVFNAISDETYQIFAKHKVEKPNLKIRSMGTMWGSCSPAKKIITLNKRLIEAPKNCIEYVMMHEYCHFVHPNHSKKFYNFMSTLMPDWRERKRILETFGSGGY